MKYLKLAVVAAVTLLVAAGCAAQRQGVSWANLTILEDSSILVAYNDFIVQVDSANGRPVPLRNSDGEIRTDANGNPRRWEINGGDTDSRFFTGPIWLDEETFLAADYNHKVLTVDFPRADPNAGRQIPLPGRTIANPAVASGNILIIPFSESNLAAYDMETSDQIWLFETSRGFWAAPLVVNDIVYAAGMDHQLYALDVETGNVIWKQDMGGAIGSQPFLDGDHFYLGTFNRAVFEVSLEGEIRAEYETENWVWGTPQLVDGVLYVTDLSGFVYALDANNNLSEIWKVEAASNGIRSRPLIVNEWVIVGDRDGQVYWINRETGAVNTEFTQDAGGEILSDLVLLEREDREPLIIVSTVDNDAILVAYTLDAVANWTYGR